MKRIFASALAVLLAFTFLCACTENAKSADLTAVMKSMEENPSVAEMMNITVEKADEYYGIPAEDIKQLAGKLSTTGINCDEIVLIEATDSAAAQRIEQKLQSRYGNQAASFKDYLPEQYKILKDCSVELSGNYVSMIISPDAEALTKTYKDSFK